MDMVKCRCFICKTEGAVVASTDLVCRPCYEALQAENERLKKLSEASGTGEAYKQGFNDAKE
jgi:hypothetical protein